jgi:hypothetical protein
MNDNRSNQKRCVSGQTDWTSNNSRRGAINRDGASATITKKGKIMKTLKWLVILIACCAPPCLWSACDSADERDSYESTEICDEFYQALLDEWSICSNGNERVKANLTDMRQKCENTVKAGTVPYSIYAECIGYGIGCDMETGHVVVIEPCFAVLGAD